MRTTILLAGLLAIQPALAFEDLRSVTGLLPTDISLQLMFEYDAPLGGFSRDSPTLHGPSDVTLANALVSQASPDAATGIDFAGVKGVLQMGVPPTTTTLIFGQPGFLEAAYEALPTRGFEQSEIDFDTVMARGEDYAIDFNARLEPDPLGSNLGKSQRLALLGDLLISTAGWPEMETALAARTEPGPGTEVWAALIEGLETASGDSPHLAIASAWSVSAFVTMPDLTSPPAKIKTTEPGTPLFPYAMIGVTQSGDTAAARIALPVAGDEALAEEAAATVAGRIEGVGKVTHEVVSLDNWSIAVISVETSDARAAREIYVGWLRAIQSRQFAPLALP
jgi:hypothetical protein